VSIVFDDGDKIPVLGREYTLCLAGACEVLEGTDDGGACVEHEKIYIRPGEDAQESLIHEITEAVKWELLGVAKVAMEELIHD